MKELMRGETITYPLLRDPVTARHFRVLVADNHEVELRLLIQQLGEAWPFARDLVAECATDGVEALQKLRCQAYALMMLDWNLPHVDGTPVLQAIRAEGLRVPVIVVSTQQRAAIATDLESLAAAFVNKSQLNPPRLLNAMAGAILLQQRVFGLVTTDPIQSHRCISAHSAEGNLRGEPCRCSLAAPCPEDFSLPTAPPE